MELKYILAVAGFLICLLFSFTLFSLFCTQSRSENSLTRKMVVAFYSIFAAAVLAILYFYPHYFDFVTAAGSLWIIIPLSACFVIAATVFLPSSSSPLLTPAVLIVTIAGCLLLLPNFYINFLSSPLLDRLLTFALWIAAAFSLRVLNGIPGLVICETATVTLGIFALSFIGGAPVLIGLVCVCCTAVLLGMATCNWYPPRFVLNAPILGLIGFLFGWLICFASAEGAGSCIFIFSLLLIIETTIALLKKLTFLPAFSNTEANTISYQTNLSGLNPALICQTSIRLNVILLLFGCFQVFAPNFYSLPTLCAVLTLWHLYRIRNWQTIPGSLKDINRRFVKDVKSEVNNLKKNLRKNG